MTSRAFRTVECGDGLLRVDDLEVRRRHDVGGADLARSFHFQPNPAETVAQRAEVDRFDVEEDVNDVLLDVGQRRVLVLDAFDPHPVDREAFDGAEQHPPKGIAQRRAIAATKRPDGEDAMHIAHTERADRNLGDRRRLQRLVTGLVVSEIQHRLLFFHSGRPRRRGTARNVAARGESASLAGVELHDHAGVDAAIDLVHLRVLEHRRL